VHARGLFFYFHISVRIEKNERLERLMGRYDFDKVWDRKNTDSVKWNSGMQRKGRDDLLPLWVADMDFKLPDEVLLDIVKRVEHGIFGYSDPGEEYLGPVREWYRRRHGFESESDWITVAPGVVYSIALAVRTFTEPGDAVIIQQPVYRPFFNTIVQNGRKPVNNPLLYKDGRYEIDFDDFEKKIIEEQVKLFILCSPHNPVGRVWSRDELKRMADICRAHDVYVFADEIHSDFVYSGHRHVPYITLGEEYWDRLIVGTSASKTFNLAGMQIANVFIPDETARKKFRDENNAAGYSQPNVLGMVATKAVYEKGEQWLDELLLYLKGNLDYVRGFLADNLPQVKLVEAEGTYLIWLDFSGVTNDHKELEKIIVDGARLWLDPGIIFGRESALFERVNIACPRSILERAMEQLKEALTRQTM
jgi:cystathionine beta-lyase